MGLIEVEGLAVGPGKRLLARGISFTLAPGDVICVLGPNGAGKTTLFRTLLGLLPIRTGTVRLNGQPLGTLGRVQVARALAYVPQALSVPFAYSALDFVMAGRTARLGPFAGPGAADEMAARAALHRLAIAHLAEEPVTRLSGGERQLVLIARALAQDAPAILLDEPAAALDFANRERLADIIERLAIQGLGLMFSTHDPGQAMRLAGRVLTIDGDGVTRLGPTVEQLHPDRLAALYAMPVGAVRRGLAPFESAQS